MNTLDMRGKDLKEICWHSSAYPAQSHHCNAITYSHRETTDNDIMRTEIEAMRQGADMIMIQEYGIAWYIPNS